MSLTMTPNELAAWYLECLSNGKIEGGTPAAAKRFSDRLVAKPESAVTEAAVFHYLKFKNLQPRVLEDASMGGSDFECSYGELKFAVEATALGDETVTERSGFPNELVGAQYIQMPPVLSLLRSRFSSKAAQAAKYLGPRVLAIGSTHVAGSVLFYAGIEEFITGEQTIKFPVGPKGATGDSFMATQLKNAAFVRLNSSGQLELFRRKYTLVLLLAIHGAGAHVLGFAHPEPEYPLPLQPFRNVPFARLCWPVLNNQLSVEWVIPGPRADLHYFVNV